MTIAEQIAQQFDNDGTTWQDLEGVELSDILEARGSATRYGDTTLYRFDDGSTIVTCGAVWDLGAPVPQDHPLEMCMAGAVSHLNLSKLCYAAAFVEYHDTCDSLWLLEKSVHIVRYIDEDYNEDYDTDTTTVTFDDGSKLVFTAGDVEVLT